MLFANSELPSSGDQISKIERSEKSKESQLDQLAVSAQKIMEKKAALRAEKDLKDLEEQREKIAKFSIDNSQSNQSVTHRARSIAGIIEGKPSDDIIVSGKSQSIQKGE